MAASGKVKLTSSDNETFEVDISAAKMSEILSDIMEGSGTKDEILVPNVNSRALKKVIEYCTMHKDATPPEIEKPLKSTNLADAGVSEQDLKFLEMEQEPLFELILAANFLNVKSLLELTCAHVSSMIHGPKTKEIRKAFNIVNDFTPEQEAQIREENEWEDA